jgi:hypothetical protein
MPISSAPLGMATADPYGVGRVVIALYTASPAWKPDLRRLFSLPVLEVKT